MSIEIERVGKRFGDFVALDDVSLSIPTGQLTALLGPSGGGKSTLLRIIAGLEQADEGRIDIEGTDATGLPPRKRNVGFVFQHYAAFKHLSVYRNVAFGLEIRKRPKDEIKQRVHELLELVHLEQFADRLPSQLSGGQRQRMALARALAVEPKVLLLDEPFGALDAKVRKELRDWLRRLHDEVHVTTVFVTHDQEEALEVADEIVVINEGRIEQIGSPDQLYDEPANEFVMRFLGPVTQLGRDLVRPHDLHLHSSDPGGATGGEITRVVRVGFEVRVELTTTDQVVLVTLTRAEFQALGLGVGDRAWIHPATGAPTVTVGTIATELPTFQPEEEAVPADGVTRYDERPTDHTPVGTDDLPPTPIRDRNIPATAWREAPASLLGLGADLPGTPVAEYKRRIHEWLLWRAGPASGGDARYWAARPAALDDPVTFRLFPDGTGDGEGPDGSHHTRFRSWKESLLGR